MRLRILGIGLLALLLLDGCALFRSTKGNQETGVGFEITGAKIAGGSRLQYYGVHGQKGIGERVAFALTYIDEDWRTYHKAYLENGRELKLEDITRDNTLDSGLWAYRERFSILLPEGYIKSHCEGFSVRVVPKRGEELQLDFSAKYLKPIIQYVERPGE